MISPGRSDEANVMRLLAWIALVAIAGFAAIVCIVHALTRR